MWDRESGSSYSVFSMLADFYRISVDYLLGRTACANGVDAYKEPVLENYVVDNLVADVLSLNTNGRKAVFDYIALQKKWTSNGFLPGIYGE